MATVDIYNLADTWNNGGTVFNAIKMNVTDTASDAASLLMDLQVGAASKFKVAKTGETTITGAGLTMTGNISSAAWTTSGLRLKGSAGTLTDTTSTGTVAAAYTNVLGGNTIAASSATTFTNYYSTYISEPTAGTNVTLTNKWALGVTGNISVNGLGYFTTGVGNASAGLNIYSFGSARFGIGTGGAGANAFQLRSDGLLSWSSSTTVTGSSDLTVARDAANTLALRNSTNAQTFNVYNTYTDASNYERGVIRWSSNVLIIGHEYAGTGSQRQTHLYSRSGLSLALGDASNPHSCVGTFRPSADNSYDLGISSAQWRTGLFGTSVESPVYKTTTALVTTTDGGSTAAFTANMVGSTGGPTTAAQNGWLKMQDSAGATVWVPVWK